jgi:hypothetical protein
VRSHGKNISNLHHFHPCHQFHYFILLVQRPSRSKKSWVSTLDVDGVVAINRGLHRKVLLHFKYQTLAFPFSFMLCAPLPRVLSMSPQNMAWRSLNKRHATKPPQASQIHGLLPDNPLHTPNSPWDFGSKTPRAPLARHPLHHITSFPRADVIE